MVARNRSQECEEGFLKPGMFFVALDPDRGSLQSLQLLLGANTYKSTSTSGSESIVPGPSYPK